ncbi:MAG: MarR family transcriptional regulator [Methanomassiliicoccales archaeon]|nr:MAG: MarR family transcriptional regulator [Methanomassiliicoccales archaeon]
MTVLFGTLGWRPQSLTPSIRTTPNIESLYFYHSEHKKSIEAKDRVVEYCNGIGLPVVPIQLSDAFNLVEIAKKIKEDIRKVKSEGRSIARFNIAGGTRLMSSAALLVCILEGIPTIYVHDETFEEIQLPLLQIEYSSGLTTRQKEILDHMRKSKNETFTQTELAKEMKIHKATMNHHITELRKKGMILVSKDENDERLKNIRLAPSVDLLLE